MATILIAEDEEVLNNLITMNMELMGHTCIQVFDGEAVFSSLEANPADLVLLDIMLPKKDGFEVIKEMGGKVPVIFLTAKSGVDDRVRGLNLGADDYIVKPFSMLELQARVASVLRRTKKMEDVFILGDVRVDVSSREVYYNGRLVTFAPQELLLIEALIKNRNIVLSRDQLLDIAWGRDFLGTDRTVDVHISHIRKKLGWEKVIKTVYRLGYRLEVPK